jgi:hypothetical protein
VAGGIEWRLVDVEPAAAHGAHTGAQVGAREMAGLGREPLGKAAVFIE